MWSTWHFLGQNNERIWNYDILYRHDLVVNCYYNKISYCKYISKGNGLGISLTLKLFHKLKVSNAAIIFDIKFSYSVVLFRGVFFCFEDPVFFFCVYTSQWIPMTWWNHLNLWRSILRPYKINKFIKARLREEGLNLSFWANY